MITRSMPAGQFLLRRLLQAVPLVLGVLTITFVLIHLAPGDPITILAGDGGDAAYYAQMRTRYGLDRPLPVQLARYVSEVTRGDFGYSFSYGQPVYRVILSRVPATLLLMSSALVISTAVGLGLGMLAAKRPRSVLDYGITTTTLAVYAMPVFWLGQLLIILFAVHLRWLPVQGMVSARSDATGLRHALDVLHHLVLPALTLGLVQLALTTQLVRTSLGAALSAEYIRTARAKGLPEGLIVRRHALRNALLPVVTVIGGQVGLLLTGATLTETIFAWPGLGRLLLDATRSRDYPLLMATFILVAVTVVMANVITDLVYLLIDPRIRFG